MVNNLEIIVCCRFLVVTNFLPSYLFLRSDSDYGPNDSLIFSQPHGKYVNGTVVIG